jgi:hypothetical protein
MGGSGVVIVRYTPTVDLAVDLTGTAATTGVAQAVIAYIPPNLT